MVACILPDPIAFLKEDAASPGVPRRGGSGSTAEVSRVDNEESTVGWLLGGEVEEEDSGGGLFSGSACAPCVLGFVKGGRFALVGWLDGCSGSFLVSWARRTSECATSLAARLGWAASVVLGVSVASWLDCSSQRGDPGSRIDGGGPENAGLLAETSDDIAGGVRSARSPLGPMNGDAAIVLPAIISDSATMQVACIVRRSSA